MNAQSQAIQLERNCNTSNCALFSLEMKSAFNLFHRTNDYAENVRQDIWQFAITIGELRQMGLSDSDMRWLLCRGDLLHADEITSVGDSRRTFRSLGVFTLTTSTCFVLCSDAARLSSLYLPLTAISQMTRLLESQPSRQTPGTQQPN